MFLAENSFCFVFVQEAQAKQLLLSKRGLLSLNHRFQNALEKEKKKKIADFHDKLYTLERKLSLRRPPVTAATTTTTKVTDDGDAFPTSVAFAFTWSLSRHLPGQTLQHEDSSLPPAPLIDE